MSNDVDNLILYFTASWCEPCKKTRPIVEGLNMEQRPVKFFIIDVNDANQMAKDFGISSIPTFVLIKDSKQIAKMTGQRDKENLEEMFKFYEQ